MTNLYKYFKLTYKNLFLKSINSAFVSNYGLEYLNLIEDEVNNIKVGDLYNLNFNHSGQTIQEESKLLGEGQTTIRTFIFNIEDYLYDTNGDGIINSINGRLYDILQAPTQGLKLIINNVAYEINDILVEDDNFRTNTNLVTQVKFSFVNEEDYLHVLNNEIINHQSYIAYSETINNKNVFNKFYLFSRINTSSDFELESMFGIINDATNSLDDFKFYIDVDIPLIPSDYDGLTNDFVKNLQISKLFKHLGAFQYGLLNKFKHYLIDKSYKNTLITYEVGKDFPTYTLNNEKYFDYTLSSNTIGLINAFFYCNYSCQYYDYQNKNILKGMKDGVKSGLLKYKEYYSVFNNTEYNEKFMDENTLPISLHDSAYNEYLSNIEPDYNAGDKTIWYLESLISYSRLVTPVINYYRDNSIINLSDYDNIYNNYLKYDIARNTYLKDFNYNLTQRNTYIGLTSPFKRYIYSSTSIINLINDFKLYLQSIKSFDNKTDFLNYDEYSYDVKAIHTIYKNNYNKQFPPHNPNVENEDTLASLLYDDIVINDELYFSKILDYVKPIFTYNKFKNLASIIGESKSNFNLKVIDGLYFFNGTNKVKQLGLINMLNISSLYDKTNSYYINWFNNFYIYLHLELDNTMTNWLKEESIELDTNRDLVEKDVIISEIIKDYETPETLITIPKEEMINFIRGINNE